MNQDIDIFPVNDQYENDAPLFGGDNNEISRARWTLVKIFDRSCQYFAQALIVAV